MTLTLTGFRQTAFAIIELFSIINEFAPREINIVVDACHAGGASFDLGQLLKPEIIGSSEASSVAFLGACSAEQMASETANGGFMTNEFVKCLTGEREVQNKWPFLDLIDVAATVCGEVLTRNPAQRPISWGLSLFGKGRLAQNPHFVASSIDPIFPVPRVLPTSEIGKKVRMMSSVLWAEYRNLKDDFSARRLCNLLNQLFAEGEESVAPILSFLEGFSQTLSIRVAGSNELLARSHCLATCVVSLLRRIDSPEVQRYVRTKLREIIDVDIQALNVLQRTLRSNECGLLGATPMADLYYLPLRITKTVGWIGLSIIIEAILPELEDGNDELRFQLIGEILDRYESCMVAMSDEQAPSLYVFLQACLIKRKRELAGRIANLYFASFVERAANVTRAGTDGSGALRYILSLTQSDRADDWRSANPSYLLAVLLICGAKLDLGSAWDLRALDRKRSCFFMPADYRHFADALIEDGINHSHEIGFGVWTASQFAREFNKGVKAQQASDKPDFPKEGAVLCTISSLLFPDRVPFLLEAFL